MKGHIFFLSTAFCSIQIGYLVPNVTVNFSSPIAANASLKTIKNKENKVSQFLLFFIAFQPAIYNIFTFKIP